MTDAPNLDAVVAAACARIPALLRGALVFLPGGFMLARATRAEPDALDLEPLIRAAARALAPAAADEVVECVFVVDDQLVVVHRGARDARLALAVACERDRNLGFALATARAALKEIEDAFDFGRWGL